MRRPAIMGPKYRNKPHIYRRLRLWTVELHHFVATGATVAEAWERHETLWRVLRQGQN